MSESVLAVLRRPSEKSFSHRALTLHGNILLHVFLKSKGAQVDSGTTQVRVNQGMSLLGDESTRV